MPMSTTQSLTDSRPLERYGTGAIHFAGNDSGLYERHLLFDNVIPARYVDARDRFEAFARSGRDVLSQRWTLTQETYTRQAAKRIYYLSMEFLIGRSLANKAPLWSPRGISAELTCGGKSAVSSPRS